MNPHALDEQEGDGHLAAAARVGEAPVRPPERVKHRAFHELWRSLDLL
jgi:hypothetical protein